MPKDQYLAAIENALKQHRYGESPEELYKPILYLMNLGGKRLRPVLVLLAYHLFKDDWQRALKPAMAVEVFHNFTLMHDDIMDQAPFRRGMPTVHEKWGRDEAMLSGDVMLVAAYELLAETELGDFRTILKRFNRTAAEVCEGQQLDMDFSKQAHVIEAEYLEMIRLKTSALLAFALELGGRLAGQSEETVQHLYRIGINLGLGFQIMDDVLDVYGKPEKFGKQVAGDIRENKKTWLMIKALELCEDNSLRDWINKTEFDSEEKVKAVKAIYARYEIKEKAEAKMDTYFKRAFADIDDFPVNEEAKQRLIDFAKPLYAREQ